MRQNYKNLYLAQGLLSYRDGGEKNFVLKPDKWQEKIDGELILYYNEIIYKNNLGTAIGQVESTIFLYKIKFQ